MGANACVGMCKCGRVWTVGMDVEAWVGRPREAAVNMRDVARGWGTICYGSFVWECNGELWVYCGGLICLWCYALFIMCMAMKCLCELNGRMDGWMDGWMVVVVVGQALPHVGGASIAPHSPHTLARTFLVLTKPSPLQMYQDAQTHHHAVRTVRRLRRPQRVAWHGHRSAQVPGLHHALLRACQKLVRSRKRAPAARRRGGAAGSERPHPGVHTSQLLARERHAAGPWRAALRQLPHFDRAVPGAGHKLPRGRRAQQRRGCHRVVVCTEAAKQLTRGW
eukprot:351494-Chlamydomonas_euryale.AAC.2